MNLVGNGFVVVLLILFSHACTNFIWVLCGYILRLLICASVLKIDFLYILLAGVAGTPSVFIATPTKNVWQEETTRVSFLDFIPQFMSTIIQ